MTNQRTVTMFRQMFHDGGPFDYGPSERRLVVELARALAKGRPVSLDRANQMAADLGVAQDAAGELLDQIAERDADNNIVGVLPGLSLNEHPHRFSVNGVQMSTWCAADTLGLPAVLDQTADVESRSPVSGEMVRLRVSPERVEEASPVGAVVSIVIVEPDKADANSVEEIWGTFCHHIFFFASQEEAGRWAAGRDDIEILSLDEGFEIVKLAAARLLSNE